jgi:hypothetical protein
MRKSRSNQRVSWPVTLIHLAFSGSRAGLLGGQGTNSHGLASIHWSSFHDEAEYPFNDTKDLEEWWNLLWKWRAPHYYSRPIGVASSSFMHLLSFANNNMFGEAGTDGMEWVVSPQTLAPAVCCRPPRPKRGSSR